MARVTLRVNVRQHWWFGAACEAVKVLCALISFVSDKAAERFADWTLEILVKRGIVIECSSGE